MKLIDFIIKAKKSTYASGNKATKLKDDFEEFIYGEGNFKYRDRYHAKDPEPFGGEEVVWQNEIAVWMMNYYGFMLSNDIDSQKVYQFLRKAMSLVEKQRPFRGPNYLKEDDFEYIDQSEGDVQRFKGTERIFFQGKEIYRLEYHGGKLGK